MRRKCGELVHDNNSDMEGEDNIGLLIYTCA